MASVFQVSTSELLRVHAASYEGKVVRFCLAFNSALTIESTTAQWDAVELASANGYARAVITIPSATYDSNIGMAKTSELTATFTASGVGFTFNRVYGVIGAVSGGVTTWNTNISYLWVETESIGLSPGVSRPYKVVLLADNKTSSPL
jgi:phage tail protein X